jgi:mannan endo-1,4-beta-mannosidase
LTYHAVCDIIKFGQLAAVDLNNGGNKKMKRRQIKRILGILTVLTVMLGCLPFLSFAADGEIRYQFDENTRMTGTAEFCNDNSTERVITGYDGTGAILLDNTNPATSISIDVEAPEKGLYEIVVSYYLPAEHGESKIDRLSVNGVEQANVTFLANESFAEVPACVAMLKEGTNEVSISAFWGWVYYDYIVIRPKASPGAADITPLTNPNASNEAKSLYAYLKSIYGKNILSGQQEQIGGGQEDEFNYLMTNTGKMPAVRGFDFMPYCSLHNKVTPGWDDGACDRLIKWYNETGGIPTLCYHWKAPFGNHAEGDGQYFYTEDTDFSVSQAVIPGTPENIAVLEDIEILAEKLQLTEDAGVPILFRPLHEAAGGWFWWGAEGYEACIALYRIMYEELTDKYGLDNLIWVWNYENAGDAELWYPGDDVVDIVGYDKYNSPYGSPTNLSPIAGTYYKLVDWTDGKKMVAMTENDSIPAVAGLQEEGAAWLWFCPWYGEHLKASQYNPVDNLNEIYNSEYCITLDELPDLKNFPTGEELPEIPEIPEEGWKWGDAGNDKEVTAEDIVLIAKILTGDLTVIDFTDNTEGFVQTHAYSKLEDLSDPTVKDLLYTVLIVTGKIKNPNLDKNNKDAELYGNWLSQYTDDAGFHHILQLEISEPNDVIFKAGLENSEWYAIATGTFKILKDSIIEFSFIWHDVNYHGPDWDIEEETETTVTEYTYSVADGTLELVFYSGELIFDPNISSLKFTDKKIQLNSDLLSDIGLTYDEIVEKRGAFVEYRNIEGGSGCIFENGYATYCFDGIYDDWFQEFAPPKFARNLVLNLA